MVEIFRNLNYLFLPWTNVCIFIYEKPVLFHYSDLFNLSLNYKMQF